MSETSPSIFQLKVTLRDIEPAVWRRIQLYQHRSFYHLHQTIQVAFGWLDYHLHQFEVDGVLITDLEILQEWDEDGVDEHRACLMDFLTKESQAFTYEYDFGDSWVHDIVLEARVPADPDIPYPRCLAGARSRPPEDVGGTWGYELFLEAIRDPEHPEHEEYLTWIGGKFDPEAFELAEVNRRLRDGYPWSEGWVVPPLATRPAFSAQAERRWLALPATARAHLLATAWCATCSGPVTMIDYQGRLMQGDLLLEGRCPRCGKRVAQLVAGP